MKQTKQFLRPLLMAIVMLVGMLVPQGAWAEELVVSSGNTVTISSNTNYEFITVLSGGTLIINEGVSVSTTASGYIVADGTVINYGTINGIAVYEGATFANHGDVSDNIFANGGTIYNTGTYVNKSWNNIDAKITPCEHTDCSEVTVEATCTHAGGKQTKCNVCYYIKSFEADENSPALGHSFDSHNGINSCTRCGLATYDAPELKSGYYQIANAGNLYWFADKVNNDYANFKYANAKLTADIVVNDITFDNNQDGPQGGQQEQSNAIAWPGIGNLLRDTNDPEEGHHEEGDDRIKGYEGIFDGQGHTISGLYSRNGAAGLVEVSAGNCIIKNVGVVNSYFLNGMGIGVICNVCADNTEISNCYSNAICKGDIIGGIVGNLVSNQARIKNCYSTSTLSSWNSNDDRTGGIVGQALNSDGIPYSENESTALGANISNCYTTYKQICSNVTGTNCEASVSADRFASGEIAWLLNGSVDGEGSWTAGATNGTQAWYQKLGENGDSYPVLAAAEGNTVYEQKIFNCGGTVVACNYNNTEEEDVTQPHDYQVQQDENEKPVFVWSEYYTTATLQLVCSHNAEHTANVEVTGEGITSEDTTPATCTTAGVRTYTAKATYEGVEYTGTKEVEISATGHDYQVQLDEDNNPVFVWSEDYTSATLQLVCSHNAEHTANVEATIKTTVDVEPTCTTAGSSTITATATYNDQPLTSSKSLTLTALGHTFVEETDPDHTHCTVCNHWMTYYTTTGEDIAGIEDRVGAVDHYFKEGNGYFETEECFTSVPEGAFFDIDQETTLGLNLKSISLPFVTRVENEAFNNCQSLESVTLPEATTIGANAFAMCKALTAISLPEATTIGADAFSTDITLESISLPKAVTIGDYAFDGCPNLTELTLPCNFDLDRESVGLGENESVTISRVHKGESLIIDGVPATCTEDGYKAYEGCSVCLEPFGERTVIPALGHKYYNGVCSVCGYVCQHSWDDGVCKLCDYECKHKDLDNDDNCDICGIHAQTFASLAELIAADHDYDAVNVTIDDEIVVAMPHPDNPSVYYVVLSYGNDGYIQLKAPTPDPALNWLSGGRIKGTLKYADWGETDQMLSSKDASFWSNLTYTPAVAKEYNSIDELLADENLENGTLVTVTVNGTITETPRYLDDAKAYQIVIDNGFVLGAIPVDTDPGWKVGGTISGTLENVTFMKNDEAGEVVVGIMSMTTNIFTELNYTAPAVTIGGSEIEIALNSEDKYETTTPIDLTDVAVFTATVDFIAPSVNYTRDLSALTGTNWGTLCVPFELPFDAAEGVTFYTLTSATAEAITLSPVTSGSLPAGTPVLFKRGEGTSSLGISIGSSTQVKHSTATGSASSGLTLTGTYVPTQIADGYYLATDGLVYSAAEYASENHGNKVQVGAFRAWFAGSLASSAKGLILNVDDDATALEAIDALTSGKAEYYDMQGRKLNEMQRGINIVRYGNGKTVKVNIK